MRDAKRIDRILRMAAMTVAFFPAGILAATAPLVTVISGGESRISGIYIPAEHADTLVIEAAAADLAAAFARMSGVVVPVKKVAGAAGIPDGPAIVLGSPAGELGAAPLARTRWRDTMRTVIGNGRVLIDGESGIAVNDAVMDLLHELGVRYFLPEGLWQDIGTVMPERATLAWSERDHERHPHIRARRIAGANVDGEWNRRNHGQSPVEIVGRHAWGGLIPVRQRGIGDPLEAYSAVLEYGSDGRPARRGGQFCVSNPEVAPAVAAVLMNRFREHPDRVSQSISPNDGGGHCICPDCRALDVPGHKEPSTGANAVSDRYLDFYNRIAAIVAAEFPDRLLEAYVYADYSRAPRRIDALHPMFLPVIAPIRYPRYHSMFNPVSEQGRRLRYEVEQYAGLARQIGFYGYNFNLAETVVPFSRIDVWSRDLPWLAEKGMQACILETIANWNTHLPHIYLANRYLYSGDDPAAIMNDFYDKLGGAAAGPIRAYWERIDRAYREADIHSGSFYGIEQVLPPAVLAELAGILDKGQTLAGTDRERGVIDLFRSGLRQGELAIAMINHLNGFEFLEARASRDALHTLNAELEQQGVISDLPRRYLRWFMDHVVEHASAVLDAGGRIAVKFPNQWQFRLDYYNVGVEEHWFDPAHGNRRWLTAQTWGAPSLYSQGFGDFKGPQWFKVEVEVPVEGAAALSIWFGSNDGTTRLWVNGAPVPFAVADGDAVRGAYEWPRGWRAFSAPIGHLLKPGETNTFVVRIDHTSINDLNLGGILRPVMLYLPGPEEMKAVEDTYQRMVM